MNAKTDPVDEVLPAFMRFTIQIFFHVQPLPLLLLWRLADVHGFKLLDNALFVNEGQFSDNDVTLTVPFGQARDKIGAILTLRPAGAFKTTDFTPSASADSK
ncbi:hypothetical protein IWZ00DRAFT_489568 [Phyllosticta capitalensis]